MAICANWVNASGSDSLKVAHISVRQDDQEETPDNAGGAAAELKPDM